MAGDTRHALDVEHALSRNAPPLRNGAVRDPQFAGDFHAKTALRIESCMKIEHEAVIAPLAFYDKRFVSGSVWHVILRCS